MFYCNCIDIFRKVYSEFTQDSKLNLSWCSEGYDKHLFKEDIWTIKSDLSCNYPSGAGEVKWKSLFSHLILVQVWRSETQFSKGHIRITKNKHTLTNNFSFLSLKRYKCLIMYRLVTQWLDKIICIYSQQIKQFLY